MADQVRRGTVWWRDAHASGASHTDTGDILKQHQAILLGKTGWIIRDDEIGVTVGYEWAPRDERNGHVEVYDYRGHAFVPRGMIERVEYLDDPE